MVTWCLFWLWVVVCGGLVVLVVLRFVGLYGCCV